MFTEPEIVTSDDLTKRAYVKVYINGERYRFYNGKQLSITCNPNHCKNSKDRNKALTKLSFTLRKKLEAGWVPGPTEQKVLVVSEKVEDSIRTVLTEMNNQHLSDLYKRDIEQV